MPATPEVLKAGLDHYRENCVTCHGANLQGVGEIFERRAILFFRDLVDLSEQQEAIRRREVPPELRLLSHDQRDPPPEARKM